MQRESVKHRWQAKFGGDVVPSEFEQKLNSPMEDGPNTNSMSNGVFASSPSFGSAKASQVGSSKRIKRGGALIDNQKYRADYPKLKLEDQFMYCRDARELNWFGSWVIDMRKAFYSLGFRFDSEVANVWSGLKKSDDHDFTSSSKNYPWKQVVNDIWDEYLTTDNVVALWRINDSDELPNIVILDSECVTYSSEMGVESITFSYPQKFGSAKKKVDKSKVKLYGEELSEIMISGGNYTVIKGENEDWDFEVLVRGKRGKFRPPRMVSVLDDLDFVEMIKVGNWNGAWRRKNIIDIIYKGYGIQSGTHAGRNVGHAKKKHLDDLAGLLGKVNGHTNLAFNWDTKFESHAFDSKFFSSDITKDAMRRLVNWGGFAAMIMMEGFSQATGVSPYMLTTLQTETESIRETFKDFLFKIFNSPSFRGQTGGPLLQASWSIKHLYNTEELTKILDLFLSKGLGSHETARGIFGVDHHLESERLKKEHQDRESVTPAFEASQGIVSSMVMSENELKVDVTKGNKE